MVVIDLVLPYLNARLLARCGFDVIGMEVMNSV